MVRSPCTAKLSRKVCFWLLQREEFEKLGTWRAKHWKPSMGKGVLNSRRQACGGSFLDCTGRQSSGWLSLNAIALVPAVAGVGILLRMLCGRRDIRSDIASGLSLTRLPFGRAHENH